MFFGALGVPALVLALAAVTVASYVVGLALENAGASRSIWLWGASRSTSSSLPTFKFAAPVLVWRSMGGGLLAVVGVSYFTFQGISYLVDVYARAQKPERHLGYFALYMAFFPKLLQGPIERAGDLLPQLERPFEIDAGGMARGSDPVRVGAVQEDGRGGSGWSGGGCDLWIRHIVPGATARVRHLPLCRAALL